MVDRGLRWLVAVCSGGGGFALVWWVAEVLFEQDRSTSVTIAAAAASLLATPFIFWASQAATGMSRALPPPVTSPDSAIPVDPSAPASTNRGTIIGAVVAVLAVACIGTQVYGALLGTGVDPINGDGTRGEQPAGASETVKVNKTAWYAGYKFTFGDASFISENGQVTIAADVANLGQRNVTFGLEATLSSGSQHFGGYNRDSPIIPGGNWAGVVFEFTVDRLDGSLADALLTFGEANEAQTIVPLGGGPGLVAHEPRSVLANTTITLRDLTLEFTSCDLRSDIVPDHRQAPAGHLVIACWINARYDGVSSFHYYDEEQFRLVLPDGNALGPTAYPILNLDRGVPEPNTYVAFFVKEPVEGAYAIQVVDVHTSEVESADNVKDVPLTVAG